MSSRTLETPGERFEQLCRVQGRKKSWVAAQAGMTPQDLSNKFRGRPGYGWRPAEQEAVAAALGVPVAFIWAEPAQDCDDVTASAP